MADLRKHILKSKQCPAAYQTPGKSRWMFIGRQQHQWRVKLPDQFPDHRTRYLHSEEDAADQLLSVVRPLGFHLHDFERPGYTGAEDIEKDDANDDAHVENDAHPKSPDPHVNMFLLASAAIQLHADSLNDILESQKDSRNSRSGPQLFVVRNNSRFEIQVPPELKSYMKPVPKSFATAQQAHLHLRDALSGQDQDPDLLYA